jgi:glycyl-tRNA synthetase
MTAEVTTEKPTLDTIVALAKRRGFVYPTSEIYGGLANCYDYGPLGAELMRTIRDLWWRRCIVSRDDMVGLDSQIMLHPQTWVASGHVGAFTDPMVEDTLNRKRYRADHIIEAWLERQALLTPDQRAIAAPESVVVENLSVEEMGAFILTHKILSPDGNPFTPPRSFSLLFETGIGVVADEKFTVYLRGETAQGIFSNFKQVLQSSRVKLPFGIGQIGRSFRNEITTGQFVFRTLEFEQAEIEYFFDPEGEDWRQLFADWQATMWQYVTADLGISPDNLRWRQHTDAERSHYSKETYDLDYKYSFGFKELWGIAYRTDYDLKQHQEHSGENLSYRDQQANREFIPHVIEPALGINRAFLMLLTEFYWNDTERNRIVLKFPAHLAPYQAAIFPLLKNKPQLVAKARSVHSYLKTGATQTHSGSLRTIRRITWDDRGNIGKRYLSQDEIGTPLCITIDFQTLEDDTVTLRDRDTATQERVKIVDLGERLDTQLLA